jgi:cytochrome d ubiquinol oxidase subunit II
MDLNTIWFVLIAVLYLAFFFLEGFDFGVGILLPFLGKDDLRRRMILNSVGPHWDGNEVWLLTAGGATFAAFPHWYATLFSGFYLALLLLLVALIIRGVAFEFRSKDPHPRWRALWDACVFAGSLIPAFLIGVTFANLVRGVPIDAAMNYVGGFWNLLNAYAVLGGLASTLLFALHGAIFLSLKTSADLAADAQRAAVRVWPFAALALLGYFAATYFATDLLTKLGVDPGVVPVGMAAAILVTGWLVRTRQMGWAFAMTAVSILFSVATIFLLLYPRVMVSSLNPEWSLTIYNAASSAATLRVMTTIALFLVPIVLVYQAWSYWVFRKRIEAKPETLTY